MSIHSCNELCSRSHDLCELRRDMDHERGGSHSVREVKNEIHRRIKNLMEMYEIVCETKVNDNE